MKPMPILAQGFLPNPLTRPALPWVRGPRVREVRRGEVVASDSRGTAGTESGSPVAPLTQEGPLEAPGA